VVGESYLIESKAQGALSKKKKKEEEATVDHKGQGISYRMKFQRTKGPTLLRKTAEEERRERRKVASLKRTEENARGNKLTDDP